MTTEKKPMKIEFAPGCFDSFDGTQEELDAMVKDIYEMFETMTPEELEARSTPVDFDDVDDLDEDILRQLMNALGDDNKRNLQ